MTAGDIDDDALADEWCKEKIIELPSSEFTSVESLRDSVKVSPVELDIPMALWVEGFGGGFRDQNFYWTLVPAMLEREMDIELLGVKSMGYPLRCTLVVRPLTRARPAGASLMPPFSGVAYGAPGTVIRPKYPANLSNPMVEWFFECAGDLNREYAALFVQFKHALAVAATMRTDSSDRGKDAVELMNAVMERIRRAFSDLPPALYREVYLGEGNALMQDL